MDSTLSLGAQPLLLDAKREYLSQAADVVSPFVNKLLDGMYAEAVAARRDNRALVRFQRTLRHVPEWNANVIKDHTDAILGKSPEFGDIIAAVFVSYVKVLSSIKLHRNKPSIKLKLPSTESFVHLTYTNVARVYYNYPQTIRTAQPIERLRIVTQAIEAAVKSMLPLQEIIRCFLGSSINAEDNTMNPVTSPLQSSDEEDEAFDEENPSNNNADLEADDDTDSGDGCTVEAQTPAPDPFPDAPAPQQEDSKIISWAPTPQPQTQPQTQPQIFPQVPQMPPQMPHPPTLQPPTLQPPTLQPPQMQVLPLSQQQQPRPLFADAEDREF